MITKTWSERDLERLLKAIANKRRVAILKYLKHIGRASVGDIATEIKLSLKATSKHLLKLSHVDIVEKEQTGLLIFCTLSKNQNPIISTLLSSF